MFTKADIRRVSIAVTGDDYRRVMVSLGRSGIVHIDRAIPDQAGWETSGSGSILSVNSSDAKSILSMAETFFNETGQYPGSPGNILTDEVSSLFTRESAADLHTAEKINRKIKQYRSLRARLMAEIETWEDKLEKIVMLRDYGWDIAELRALKQISYICGAAKRKDPLCEADRRIFRVTEGENILALFPNELKEEVDAMLRVDTFESLDSLIGPGRSMDDEHKAVLARGDELKRRLARIDSFYTKELPVWRDEMIHMSAVYSTLLKISGEETKLFFSKELVIINGWLNINDSPALLSLLRKLCGERFYLKTATRGESRRLRASAPVLLKNNPLFRPFELLVRMMGMPGNSEVDPTPAAAVAYVLIFGVMFGDAGQGLVLALTGFIISRYGRRKHGARNNVTDFGIIMTWCGFSAALFGLLYGSVFSNEHILPALLFHPMENMMELFFMAILAGAAFISFGLALNIINAMMAGRYGESLFGTRGLAGLAVYLSFIFFGVRFILAGEAPDPAAMGAALSIPALLFIMRGPLDFLLFHGERLFPGGPFEYIVESLIEIIEMFSGFLGNTISYIRAGAFALSHAGLSIAVFTLAEIVDPAIKSAGAIGVIVTGNLFIILLEGLVCGIQSMRLEYYEFFGKFFRGDGVAFAPFTLDLKHVKNGGTR